MAVLNVRKMVSKLVTIIKICFATISMMKSENTKFRCIKQKWWRGNINYVLKYYCLDSKRTNYCQHIATVKVFSLHDSKLKKKISKGKNKKRERLTRKWWRGNHVQNSNWSLNSKENEKKTTPKFNEWKKMWHVSDDVAINKNV